jgi:hypothetical protein
MQIDQSLWKDKDIVITAPTISRARDLGMFFLLLIVACALAHCNQPTSLGDTTPSGHDASPNEPVADAAPDGTTTAGDGASTDVAAEGSDAADSAGAEQGSTDANAIEADAGEPGDGSTGEGGDAATRVERATPPAAATLPLAFDVAIQGDMAGTTMAVSVVHDSGTLQIGGSTYPIIVYEQIPWNGFSLTLYQAIAILADRWAVIWFYCRGTALTGIDYEDTLGAPLATYDATGTCSVAMQSVDARVTAPASTLALDSLVQGFAVTGTTLAYDGSSPGSMALGARSWRVFPFNLIDCSTKCGSPGWYELHSIFWDENSSETCFGIFYLQSQAPGSVLLEYSLCLPDGTTPANSFPSHWTHP